MLKTPLSVTPLQSENQLNMIIFQMKNTICIRNRKIFVLPESFKFVRCLQFSETTFKNSSLIVFANSTFNISRSAKFRT